MSEVPHRLTCRTIRGTICSMTRRSVSFQADEVVTFQKYLVEGSDEHSVLMELFEGRPPRSESALVRALALMGQEILDERLSEARYNAAFDNGEHDAEAEAWERASLKATAVAWADE